MGGSANTALQAALALALTAGGRAQEARPDTASDPPRLRLVIPFEFAQGPRFDGPQHGFAWIGQFNLLPGLRYEGLEMSALLAAAYQSPKAEALLGARVSQVFLPIARGSIALRAAVQAAYAVRARNGDGAAGVVGDVGSLLRIGLWGGRDFERKFYYALITLGTDVLTWSDPVGAIIEAGPTEDLSHGH